jgi:aquaporin Z
MVAIYAFGSTSGGHFNPAVSIAIGLTETLGKEGLKMPWPKVVQYVLTQLFGGAMAGLFYFYIFWSSFELRPAPGFETVSAGVCEFLYTFMLCFVVLNVAVAKGNQGADGKGNHFYGLAIGFVIVAGAYGAGAVSGGCFNPAVAFGIAVGSLVGSSFKWFLIYTGFEVAAAVIAAVLFRVVRPEDFPGYVEATNASGVMTVPKFLSESIGTFFLVLTVGLNVLGKSPAGAFSIAASLMCMIYALGDKSGAHFNPAVTLAILMAKIPGRDEKFTTKDACLYMLAQVLGGVVAAFTYAFIHYGETFPLGPKGEYLWSQAVYAEIAFTFVLCLVVLCVAVSSATKDPQMYGLAIGSCVTVGGFAIGSISGGCLNPAVALGIAAARVLDGGFFFKSLLYCAVEFLGAALAAGVVSTTHGAKQAD